jgi:ABC-type nitrate/sulfonate/bicarbonate transport system permease component
MLFAIISSQKLIKSGWEEAAQVYGATGWKRIVYFALPIAAPGIVTGSIVGLGEGWEAVVGAEIIVGLRDHGLGGFFNGSSESGHLVFFGVMALLLFIFALNHMIWLPLLEKSHKMLTE